MGGIFVHTWVLLYSLHMGDLWGCKHTPPTTTPHTENTPYTHHTHVTHTPTSTPHAHTQVLKGGEWAAVTAVLIPYTTIGEGGPIAAAQMLATAAGGYLAYGIVLVLKARWALALLVCVEWGG